MYKTLRSLTVNQVTAVQHFKREGGWIDEEDERYERCVPCKWQYC